MVIDQIVTLRKTLSTEIDNVFPIISVNTWIHRPKHHCKRESENIQYNKLNNI
jgi:hypothetical protein